MKQSMEYELVDPVGHVGLLLLPLSAHEVKPNECVEAKRQLRKKRSGVLQCSVYSASFTVTNREYFRIHSMILWLSRFHNMVERMLSNYNFEVLIDDVFVKLNKTPSLSPIDRKHVLSVVNGYEDGKWQFTNFQNFIFDNIAETALSKRERDSLVNKSHSQLTAAAKNLRLTDSTDDIGTGSELAEIVLYGVMKAHFNALPVVPKIFYKQNVNDNAKGADSVHIILDATGGFSLWLGEAKFYNSIEDARLTSIISSVAAALDTEKLKKENSIITNVSDLKDYISDDTLYNRIREILDTRKSIDELVNHIHVPILLLHECNLTATATKLDDAYKQEIADHHTERANAYFKKQVEELSELIKYPSITFHLILLPVPKKKAIVEKFIKSVEHYKAA